MSTLSSECLRLCGLLATYLVTLLILPLSSKRIEPIWCRSRTRPVDYRALSLPKGALLLCWPLFPFGFFVGRSEYSWTMRKARVESLEVGWRAPGLESGERPLWARLAWTESSRLLCRPLIG